MGENLANWALFSNHKDALVIDRNARRYLVLFSAMQSPDDLIAAGMGDAYFERFWSWWDGGGMAAVAGWLMRRDVRAGGLPSRAPNTTSWDEAVNASLSPLAAIVREAMDADLPGFRGGWVSTAAIASLWAEQRGNLHGLPHGKALEKDMGSLGLKKVGRASGIIYDECKPDGTAGARPYLYHKDGAKADVRHYPVAQGYDQQPRTVVPFPYRGDRKSENSKKKTLQTGRFLPCPDDQIKRKSTPDAAIWVYPRRLYNLDGYFYDFYLFYTNPRFIWPSGHNML